jgi:hypothetical protein
MCGSDNHKPRVVLASRRNGGLRVTLLWAADTNTVAVRVRDDNTDEQFELLVEADAKPDGCLRAPVRARSMARRRLPDRRPAAGGLKASEANDMLATTIATEATRYLEATDLPRSLGLDVKRRPEADEPRGLTRPCAGEPVIIGSNSGLVVEDGRLAGLLSVTDATDALELGGPCAAARS